METLVWKESWEMGEARLDKQHRAMVNAINHLADRLDEGKGREGINKALTFLMMYVETHFREEEALMEATGFPDRAIHSAQHRRCTCRVEDLLETWRNGDTEILRELASFFGHWLNDHLGDADLRFSAFLAARPRG